VPPDEWHFDADPVATEFIGTSITSEGDDFVEPSAANADNPHILYEDFHRGYVKVDVDRERWQTTFRTVSSVTTTGPVTTIDRSRWYVDHGVSGAHEVAPVLSAV
jgi:alkaline phosphatase D